MCEKMSGLIPTRGEQPTPHPRCNSYQSQAAVNSKSHTNLQQPEMKPVLCNDIQPHYNPLLSYTQSKLSFKENDVSLGDSNLIHSNDLGNGAVSMLSMKGGSTSPLCDRSVPIQNGPYASPMNKMTDRNSVPVLCTNINGVNGSHAEHAASDVLTKWSSPVGIPPPPGPRQIQVPGSGTIQHAGNNMNIHQYSRIGSKSVPDTPVPFTGLPLPYSQNTCLSSPQITPGPSQPPSARTSRNPSPISTQRYDFMEGQFTNKMGLSPIVSQPPRNSPLTTSGISPGSVHPRYPFQVGYSQLNHAPSPVITSHPGNIPPSPSYYQSQPILPPEVPDGPVGGVADYDPELHAKFSGMSVHSSFSRLWGNENVNLLQDRNILPALPLEAPRPVSAPEKANCSPKIFRCTLTKVPESSSLLQKSRLPFGILIHPFRDVSNLPVIQCNSIVRCRNCRTYINPYVTFIDQRRWQCNLCFRSNDLPEEFLYDPTSRSYGDPARRPEIKNATMEFIAPSDYMLRPPQPAVYLFVLDVSYSACEIGYLEVFCNVLMEQLDELPGDSRTKVGFMTFDGSIHFYNLADGLNQPHMLIVSDVDDVFLPSPDNLLVNLHESKPLIRDLLEDLPKRFASNWDSNSCLGAALQVAYKLMSPIGGRVTVVQTCLPNYGPGLLKNREDPNQRAAKDVSHVSPANDFYKKLALECSSQQIAVDLFLLCSQYVDIATVSCIAKYSSGCIHYYPGYHHQLCKAQEKRFACDLIRYFTRRIGFEAVMRIRCTKGLSIHTFHGNFFVRSTDLLSLPNVNPDVGFGMQIAIDESLAEFNAVCFQAAVLYTSSNGERRIRVHTLSLPVVSILNDIWGGADQEAIIGLVSKMAVDRSISSSLSDARDALINVCIDLLGAYKTTLQSTQSGGALVVPYSSRLIPLFILALLKHVAFRTGVSTKLDDRVNAMEHMKTLPLTYLMKYIYPSLYPVHALDDKNAIHQDDDSVIPQPVLLQLSSEKVDRHGVYLLDTFDMIYLYVGRAVNDHFCQEVLGVSDFSAIPEDLTSLPDLPTPESERLRYFVSWLQDQRPSSCPIKIIREDSNARHLFLQYMLDDRTDSLFSYYEFLQHLRQQISK